MSNSLQVDLFIVGKNTSVQFVGSFQGKTPQISAEAKRQRPKNTIKILHFEPNPHSLLECFDRILHRHVGENSLSRGCKNGRTA